MTPSDLALLQSTLLDWTSGHVAQTVTNASSTTAGMVEAWTSTVAMTEGANITVFAYLQRNASVEALVTNLPHSASEHLCENTRECSVAAFLGAASILQGATAELEQEVLVSMSRQYDLGDANAAAARRLTASAGSPWELGDALASSPLSLGSGGAANFTFGAVMMTEVSANVIVSVTTRSGNYTMDTATDVFTNLRDTSVLMTSLAAVPFIDTSLLQVGTRVEYVQNDGTRVTLEGGPAASAGEEVIAVEEGSGESPPAVAQTGSILDMSPEQVASVSGAVSTAVAAAVAASVATAVGGAVAGSVGGAVGGAAGGAAGGGAGGGAAGGGGGGASGAAAVMPLVFGAQRMSASSGLAVNKSALQSGVSGGLGWSTGQLGLVTPDMLANAGFLVPSSASRRLTSASEIAMAMEMAVDHPCVALLDTLSTYLIASIILAVVRAVTLFLWYCVFNKRYYREKAQPLENAASEDVPRHRAALHSKKKMRRPARFRPYPGSLVFRACSRTSGCPHCCRLLRVHTRAFDSCPSSQL